jgi:O-antigen/teichoic acid export membrane protein
MAQNGLAFLKERSATFIIGRLGGPATLGTFSVAAEIASMPGTELVAPINRAILPAYVKLAEDPQALGREYLSVMSGITLLAVPAVAGVALSAPFVVLLALGPKWTAAIPLLEVLAFFGITQVLQSNAYAAFIALGKPEVFAKINGFHVVALITALVALTPYYGAQGAAWAYVTAALAALPVNFYYITRFLGLRPMQLVERGWRPLVSSAAMFVIGQWLGPTLPPGATSSMQAALPLAGCVGLGVASYAIVDGLLWLASGMPEGAETWLFRQVKGIVRRVVGRIDRPSSQDLTKP